MIKIEDFENAPVGATATCADGGRAMKIDYLEQRWVAQNGLYLNNEQMAHWNYALDPSATTASREALDLAWVLAHEVKEGQTIPNGTQFLMLHNSGLTEYTAQHDVRIIPGLAPIIRTLEPLPDPEPDWLDAPAVIARHRTHAPDSRPSLWANLGNGLWGHGETTKRAEVWDLLDVTPLWPK